MKHILNIQIPDSWQSLSDDQLRFVFRQLASDVSLSQLKTLCLMKWAKMRVIRREGAAFIVKYKGKSYAITALQIAESITTMKWLDGFPGYPVRLARIGLHRPVRADFQDVSFGDFLVLDNLYQGYLQTQKGHLLKEMAKTMYQSNHIRLSREEELCIFYWFSSVKQMFANMFTHFFKSVNTNEDAPALPSYQQLQEAMNTQIRALTGGDITKEKEVLAMDCWRALTELNAKAKDYEDMKKSSK